MATRSLTFVFRSTLLALLLCQFSCVASQASKVPCDSNLRRINPTIPEKP